MYNDNIDVVAMPLDIMDDNDKPNFLVIKKEKDAELSNEIGKIFRGHNIMEYKAPNDSFNIDTFYKTQAYACFYKVDNKVVDEIKADDITVSIVMPSKPVEFFNILKDKNTQITMPYSGIYYIDGVVAWFPTQIIVTSELKGHIWLKSLSDKMEMSDMKELLYETAKLDNEREKELANSVLDVALKANKDLATKLITEGNISEELLKLVEPLIQDKVREGQILGAVNALRSFGHNDEEIKIGIMKSYNLSEEEAEKYL